MRRWINYVQLGWRISTDKGLAVERGSQTDTTTDIPMGKKKAKAIGVGKWKDDLSLDEANQQNNIANMYSKSVTTS
jgi:hypothetical protein